MRLLINLLRASSARASSSSSLDVWLFDDKRPKIRILGGGSGIAGDELEVRVVGVIGDLVVTGEVGGAGGVDVGDVGDVGDIGDVGAGGVDVDVGDVGVDVDVGAADDSGRGADRWLPASF